ncbi:unnamed protein product [Gongylonema pulchrum]|uniref:Uncharacterized protein n=1 Tax=Gongylonema pulchrum TaxID=637853 RepID=A0A183D7N3_9BILA|nr:unnamed protein product [Gongylonema pulchrum]
MAAVQPVKAPVYKILLPGAVSGIIILTIMITVEIYTYGQYQWAKNRPNKVVLTRQFLKALRQQHRLAEQQGSLSLFILLFLKLFFFC